MMVEGSSGQVSPPELLSNMLLQFWINLTMILLQMFWSFIASKPGETLEIQEHKQTQIETTFWSWSYFECDQQIWIHLVQYLNIWWPWTAVLSEDGALTLHLIIDTHLCTGTHKDKENVWVSIGNILSSVFYQIFFCPENIIYVFLAMCLSTRPEGSQSLFLCFVIIRWKVTQMSNNWSQRKSAGESATDQNNYYHHWHAMGWLALNELQHHLLARKIKLINDKQQVTWVVWKVCEPILRGISYPVTTAC